MSGFLNTLTPLQWTLLGLVPPAIILLYFLKLKRQPVEVPSTYLWKRTIEDLHVNSIWQRLRQSLLLFLQLLLIALIALALLRPGRAGTQLEGNRFIFALDASASMTATDVSPSRFEAAKKQIETMIDQMKPGDAAMLISFSSSAIVEHPFTDNRRSLRQRLAAIKPTNRTSNLEEVLRQSAGLANPGQSTFEERDAPVAKALAARLFIVTDGGLPPVPNFSIGNLQPEYVKIGESTARNFGIVQLSADRNPNRPDETQVFVQVSNCTANDESVIVSLHLDGELVDAVAVDVPAGGVGGAEFDLKEFDSGVLEARLPGGDDLAADDKAAIAVNIPRRSRILLVTPGNAPLEAALATPEAQKVAEVSIADPSILETKEHLNAAATGEFDLIIYDQCVPKEMPQCNTLTIGNAPPVEGWSAGEPVSFLYEDHNQLHPLFQLIESFSNVFIYAARPLTFPEGGVALMSADIGPIVAIAPREGFEDAVLGFSIFERNARGETEGNTDWPRRISFPIFVQNVVNYLGGVRGSLIFKAVQPAEPAIIRSISNLELIRVRKPSGQVEEVRREGQNNFVFTQTDEFGIYDILEGSSKEPTQQFAVNLCDQRESNLIPAESLQIGYEPVEVATRIASARQEYWKWLLIAGLGVLLFEWYVYNKRVYF